MKLVAMLTILSIISIFSPADVPVYLIENVSKRNLRANICDRPYARGGAYADRLELSILVDEYWKFLFMFMGLMITEHQRRSNSNRDW